MLWEGRPDEVPTTHIRMSDDAARRLLYNALPAPDAARLITIEGDTALGRTLISARSIVI